MNTDATDEIQRNPALTVVATYRRSIGASLERVWENVHDWEHLPWLHARAFADIHCKEAGAWGWRAEVRYPGGDVRSNIELLIDPTPEVERYVTRVLDGPGAQGEIWTTLTPRTNEATDIVVEFCRALEPGEDPDAVGAGYLQLYEKLWDEDEQMMQVRQAELDRRTAVPSEPMPVELGSVEVVRSRLPLDVDAFGTRLRVAEHAGEWIVYALVCPHLLGPLDDAVPVGGEVRCPWHGYRFDIASGRSCDGRRLRLANPARLEVDHARDRVRLVARNPEAA